MRLHKDLETILTEARVAKKKGKRPVSSPIDPTTHEGHRSEYHSSNDTCNIEEESKELESEEVEGGKDPKKKQHRAILRKSGTFPKVCNNI